MVTFNTDYKDLLSFKYWVLVGTYWRLGVVIKERYHTAEN